MAKSRADKRPAELKDDPTTEPRVLENDYEKHQQDDSGKFFGIPPMKLTPATPTTDGDFVIGIFLPDRIKMYFTIV
uniref:Uncharacterized protein n=1 Tax=Panagrolaimus superbus TaxID=310955 RepID=A0A914YLK9_9BILA